MTSPTKLSCPTRTWQKRQKRDIIIIMSPGLRTNSYIAQPIIFSATITGLLQTQSPVCRHINGNTYPDTEKIEPTKHSLAFAVPSSAFWSRPTILVLTSLLPRPFRILGEFNRCLKSRQGIYQHLLVPLVELEVCGLMGTVELDVAEMWLKMKHDRQFPLAEPLGGPSCRYDTL